MKIYRDSVDQLRLIQLLQLKLLLEIKRVTEILDIDYFCVAGTLLGAYRHKGFIPWDSDADIAMFRSDYKILIDNKDIFREDFCLQCDETDIYNRTGFAKLRLIGTSFIEKGNKEMNSSCSGLYVDVFPLDPFVSRSKINNYLTHVVYKYLIRLKAYKMGKRVSSSIKHTVVSNVICLPSFFVSTRSIIKWQNVILNRDNDESTQNVNNYNSKYGLEKQFMSRSVYEPCSLIEFESHVFQAPRQSHYWLERIYGDYMKLPKNELKRTESMLKNYHIDLGAYSHLIGKREKVVLKELNITT